MEATRIKIRVGPHEFEAEGPTEVVQSQLDMFRALLASMPSVSNVPTVAANSQDEKVPSASVSADTSHVAIEKIMNADGRVVSLTALPASVEDSVLLLMLGQKDLRNNISVTGQEIGDGLDQSGKPTPRVDRVMEKHMRDALVLKTGLGRATRYRLTNQGLSRALIIARELLATLP